jgi:hypothetical protein
MSVSSASFTLAGQFGAYGFTVSSCNPAEFVSFMTGGEPYDSTRLTASGRFGKGFASSVVVITFPRPPVQTTYGQNPIKLVVTSIIGGGDTPNGDTAIFYGYYTQPNAGGLGFYFDRANSQINPYTGSSPILTFLDNSGPTINFN